MKSSATLEFQTQDPQKLAELLHSEEYDFNSEIQISIHKKENGVQVNVLANTPQQLKIGTTAVINSCDVIYKTKQVLND